MSRLNEKVIQEAFSKASTTERWDFNCWGFAAAHAGWVSSLEWLDANKMLKFITNLAEPVQEPDVGDIVAYFCRRGVLQHAAVYAGNGMYYHKVGNTRFECASEAEILNIYPEVAETKRVRPKEVV
jgi:cell wall-associated NlpC family hydrolase